MDKFLGIKPKTDQKAPIIAKSSNIKAKKDTPLPWVEKYRPENLNDVVHQSTVKESLKNSLIKRKLQHLLFYGSPGTGKTSTILALVREMFGSDFKDRILELNASDERGIETVRNKVKTFSQRKISKIAGCDFDLQIVILDEADMMTNEAQSALRRVIEDYSKTTRFCIICNYLNKIIDPIASRCAKFLFSPLPRNDQVNRIKFILDKENVSIDDSVVNYVVDFSEGDLRKSINIFQTLSSLYKKNIAMSDKLLKEFLGLIPEDYFFEIFKRIFDEKLKIEGITKIVDDFNSEGYDTIQFIKQMNEIIISPIYDDYFKNLGGDLLRHKLLNVLMLSEIDFYEGVYPNLEFLNLVTNINSIIIEASKSNSNRMDLDE